jgi:hypothetical protein
MNTFSPTSFATFSFAVISSNVVIQIVGVTVLNLGFTSGGLVSSSGGSLIVSTSNFTNIASNAGNGTLFSQTSSAAGAIAITLMDTKFLNISAPYAVRGGLINVLNSSTGITLSNVTGMVI